MGQIVNLLILLLVTTRKIAKSSGHNAIAKAIQGAGESVNCVKLITDSPWAESSDLLQISTEVPFINFHWRAMLKNDSSALHCQLVVIWLRNENDVRTLLTNSNIPRLHTKFIWVLPDSYREFSIPKMPSFFDKVKDLLIFNVNADKVSTLTQNMESNSQRDVLFCPGLGQGTVSPKPVKAYQDRNI